MEPQWREEDFLSCSGSKRFSKEMVAASPFSNLDHAIRCARDIWFNKIDAKGLLEAFAAHPEIGATSKPISQWSKEEQSAALATATNSTMQELVEWNVRYREKFGFVFLICASGRGTPEILAELKRRFSNRPIVELEVAAQEEMKIIELRLTKLFQSEARTIPATSPLPVNPPKKPEARIGIIAAHLNADSKASTDEGPQVPVKNPGARPPITTHVLDVARGHPASGLDVQLEMWKDTQKGPSFAARDGDAASWVLLGSSVTKTDGRSGQLLGVADYTTPGFYRISFNTGAYNPSGFFPYVSIVFEVKESQKSQHFHVPLLLSPFSFSTYRGS